MSYNTCNVSTATNINKPVGRKNDSLIIPDSEDESSGYLPVPVSYKRLLQVPLSNSSYRC